MIVPFVSLIVLFVMAFSEWPALRGSGQEPGWVPPWS